MSVLVDSGVFYAHADSDAGRHSKAVRAFDALIDGAYGQPYTTDYVYDETVTLTLRRTGRFERAETVGRRIRGEGEFPDLLRIEHVKPPIFEAAIDVFERYDDQELSFTDATTIAAADELDVDAVVSFDDDFDGIVERIEPGDLNG
jgi:predicted nucleic acid-binding protein